MGFSSKKFAEPCQRPGNDAEACAGPRRRAHHAIYVCGRGQQPSRGISAPRRRIDTAFSRVQHAAAVSSLTARCRGRAACRSVEMQAGGVVEDSCATPDSGGQSRVAQRPVMVPRRTITPSTAIHTH